MTATEKVRLLANDESAPQQFTDDDIAAFLDLNSDYSGNDQIYMASALAYETKAGKSAKTSGFKLGDYSTNKGITADYQSAAQKLRDIVNNTPAFAVAEENLSTFNQLEIIRNYILRTEP